MNLTPEEAKALRLLRQLERIWPASLTLVVSNSGTHVKRTADVDAVDDAARAAPVGSIRIPATSCA